MKTVTLKQFIKFRPCWLEECKGKMRLNAIGKRQAEWTALDVLRLDEVSDDDKLWAVLRTEFIEENILHEFACRCAEHALSFIKSPDPRSVAGIEAKRKWLRGEITDSELSAADAAAYAAADAACAAARAAYAAADAADAAARAADAAADAAYAAALSAARAERKEQAQTLIELLEKNL